MDSSKEQTVAGRIFRFEVGLNATQDVLDAETISSKDVPGDWRGLKVEVEVHSSRLLFESGDNRKIIEVQREGATAPASFSATVRDDAAATAPVEIVVMFTYAGRPSGIARRTLEVGLVGQCILAVRGVA